MVVFGPCQGGDSAGTGYCLASVSAISSETLVPHVCMLIKQLLRYHAAVKSDNEINDPLVQDVHILLLMTIC